MFQRIAVTTDFSPAANYALTVARDLAERYGAQLTLLHVSEPAPRITERILPSKAIRGDGQGKKLAFGHKKLEQLVANAGLSDDTQVALKVHTSPVEGILEFLDEHDIELIVIATAGRTGFERFLIGSVTERVVRHAPCAVLTVKTPADELKAV